MTTTLNTWTRDSNTNTLEMRLAKATAIYIQHINGRIKTGLTDRYAAYMMIEGRLQVIWPDFEYYRHGEAGALITESRPVMSQMNGLRMSFSGRKVYPAYHFVQKGYGYSKTSEVLNTICEFARRRIPGFILSGYAPSPISEISSRILDKKETHV